MEMINSINLKKLEIKEERQKSYIMEIHVLKRGDALRQGRVLCSDTPKRRVVTQPVKAKQKNTTAM